MSENDIIRFNIKPDDAGSTYTVDSKVSGKIVLHPAVYIRLAQISICLRGIVEIRPSGQKRHVHELFSVKKQVYAGPLDPSQNSREWPFKISFPDSTLPDDSDNLWRSCAEFEYSRRHPPPPSLESTHGTGTSAFQCIIKYELVAVFNRIGDSTTAPLNRSVLFYYLPRQRTGGWDDDPAPVCYLLSCTDRSPSDFKPRKKRSSLREKLFSTVSHEQDYPPQHDPGFTVDIEVPYRIQSLNELSLKFRLTTAPGHLLPVRIRTLVITVKRSTFARSASGSVCRDTSEHVMKFDLFTYFENGSFVKIDVFRDEKSILKFVPSFRSFIITRFYSLSIEAWVESGSETACLYKSHIPLQITSPYPAKPKRVLVPSEIPLGVKFNPDDTGRAGHLDPGRQATLLSGSAPPYPYDNDEDPNKWNYNNGPADTFPSDKGNIPTIRK